MKPTQDPRTAPFVAALFIYLLLVGQTALASMAYNQGRFGYSLDDPYIHLALAKNLAHGHYGINAGEVSSPSSSLLWPFLLVPGFWLGTGVLLPLLWNLVAGAGALWVGSRILEVALRCAPEARRATLTTVLLVGFIFAVNLVGLTCTGMEHTLHLALTLTAFWGLLREREEQKAPVWLGVVLGLLPLLRYEGLALLVGAVGYLVVRRHDKSVLTALLLALVPLATFSFFLHANGQGWLPTSIVAKASTGAEWSLGAALWFNLLHNVAYLEATGVVVLTCFVLQAALRKPWRGLLLPVVGAALLHLVLGSFGWFGRYEPYLVALLWAAVVVSRARVVVRLHPALLAGILALSSVLYLPPTLQSAEASNDVHIQQYQLQRLAQLWDGPVAVNDIGWVALGSHHYVLDLYGLASREVLQKKGREPLDRWTSALTQRHEVHLVMVYESWFPAEKLPQGWVKVAVLEMNRPKVSAAQPRVALWATEVASAERLQALLPTFARGLPPQAFLRLSGGAILTSGGLLAKE